MLLQSLGYPCGVISFDLFLSYFVVCMGCRVGDLGYFSCMWSAINISLDCPEHILSSFLSESNWAHSVCWIYWTDHLPTYILFDKTTEIARFPEITSESKVFVQKVTKVISITRYSYQCFSFLFFLWINLHSFTWLWNLLLWINILVSKELKIIM
jgi:hypothetical protein